MCWAPGLGSPESTATPKKPHDEGEPKHLGSSRTEDVPESLNPKPLKPIQPESPATLNP